MIGVLNEKSPTTFLVSLRTCSKLAVAFAGSAVPMTLTFGGSLLPSEASEVALMDTASPSSLRTFLDDCVPLILRPIVVGGDELLQGIVPEVGGRR